MRHFGERWAPTPERRWLREARPEQLPPDGDRWSVWAFVGGRGSGKSRSGAEWLLSLAMGRPQRDLATIGPTFGSARDVMAEGPSGLLRCAERGEVVSYVRSLGEVRLCNGSHIYLRSADEADGVREFGLAAAWCDELAL